MQHQEKAGTVHMSEDQIRALWAKTDEHGRRITDLTIEQRTQANLIASQSERFDAFLKDQERTRSEILEAIRGHQRREGVKEFLKLIAPWIMAGLAVVGFAWQVATKSLGN